MNTSKIRLTYLFDRFYKKTATTAERDELFAVIEAGASNHELSKLIKQAWNSLDDKEQIFNIDQSHAILNNILTAGKSKPGTVEAVHQIKPRKKLTFWLKIAAAAAVLLFIGLIKYFHQKQPQAVSPKAIVKIKPPAHDALPGGNKAILTLANGKNIVLDNAQNGTLARQGNTLVKKAADGQLVYNAANLTDATTEPAINTIITPRGGQYQVVLPDGTKIWLNAASSLRFPTRFTGNARIVEITGEAYFEVTKNAGMPFKVKTNRAEIEVLGTHFNIMAYNDEAIMKTTLLEGSVKIKADGFNATLKPGQQAQLNSTGKAQVVNDVDVEDEVAWKNGIFQFRDASIDVILRQAARWYDVAIVYNGKLPHKEFTGHISRNVKASELLNMLQYSGIKLKIEGKNIIIL